MIKTKFMAILSILSALALLNVGSYYSPTLAQSPYFPTEQQLTNAANYLEQLYDPSIGLCRETSILEPPNETILIFAGEKYTYPTNKTYWVASDNYLASLALKKYNLPLSEDIKNTCDSYLQSSVFQGLPFYPYQIIEGKEIPLTLHVTDSYVLEHAPDHIIGLDISIGQVNGSNYLDYQQYGDTLVYEAINYYVKGYPVEWYRTLYMNPNYAMIY
jgi:hypothetical protein